MHRLISGNGVVSCSLLGGLLATVVTLAPGFAASSRSGQGPSDKAVGTAVSLQERALVPVRGVIGRRIDPAPAGAGAIRVSVLGDGSKGRLQVRLLAPGEDGALTGYYAAPDIVIDFEGWKTLVLPLSSFTFRSETNPEIERDGMGNVDNLTNAVGVQLAVLSSSTKLFFDDLAWVGAGASPTDAPLAVIDSFDDGDAAANWKEVGDFNERRSVERSINKVAGFLKNGSGSLLVVVRSRSQSEVQLYEPALRARLSRTPTMPYALFTRPAFEAITPDSTPAPAEVKPNNVGASLNLFACAGEIEPATFAVYTALPLKNATVAIKGNPATVAAKGKKAAVLPAAAIDIHVVRNGGTAENAPQLLMKDDRQSLAGPLPTVRLTGAPTTDIPGGSTKQFWITVRVPKNQAPGVYKGTLVFSASGVKPTPVAMTLEVLPLNLRTAHFQYGIDLPSVLQPGDVSLPGERVVTPEQLAAQLANLNDHGFKLIALHGKASSLAEPLRAYKNAGLSAAGPIIVASPLDGPGDFAAVEALRSSAGLSPAFEFYYRLPGTALTDTSAARQYTNNAKQANRNALVVAPVDSSGTYGTLTQASGESLAPIYAVSSDYGQKVLKEGRRFTSNRDWWSWNITRQSPVRNRLLAGYLLMKTGNGLYGAIPGPYQYLPEGTDPAMALQPSADATAALSLPQFAAFPVAGGVLDTLQWEAVREGVDDVRYADVLKTLSRELKDLKIRKDATDLAESYLIGVLGKPMLTLPPRDHQLYRRGIADQCLKLQAILTKSPK